MRHPGVRKLHGKGLLAEHVAVERGHGDAAFPQRADHRVDLVSGEHEIAVTAALPLPVGWKLSAVARRRAPIHQHMHESAAPPGDRMLNETSFSRLYRGANTASVTRLGPARLTVP
jgi:hypothetical protein